MKKVFVLGLALALVLSLSAVAAAAPTFTIYDSLLAFVAACPDNKIQDFDEALPGVLNPGVTVTTVNGFVDLTGNADVWFDIVVPSGATTTWSFTPGVHGVGAFFDLFNPGGPGTGIDVYADGNLVTTISPSISNTTAGQFFGFLSTDTFTNILFAADGQSGAQETYIMDDLHYCPAPIPGSILLLGSGLLGLVGLRRRS